MPLPFSREPLVGQSEFVKLDQFDLIRTITRVGMALDLN
jgi:hypothetical protein